MIARVLCGAMVVATLFATPVQAAGVCADEWYRTTGNTLPQPVIHEEMIRDFGLMERIHLRAVLAILKRELVMNPRTEPTTSDAMWLVRILDDPELKITYSGKQSTLQHSSGAQTNDNGDITIHQDGLFAQGAPRGPFELAKILIHELGHVYNVRHNWIDRKYTRWKEAYSEQLESQLDSAAFSDDCVEAMAKYINGETPPPEPAGFGGRWRCTTRGYMTVEQSETKVTGEFGGFEDGSGAWGKGARKGGTLTGTVHGDTMHITMDNGDGTFSVLTATLQDVGDRFEGGWEWYRSDKLEKRIAGGGWSGVRVE